MPVNKGVIANAFTGWMHPARSELQDRLNSTALQSGCNTEYCCAWESSLWGRAVPCLRFRCRAGSGQRPVTLRNIVLCLLQPPGGVGSHRRPVPPPGQVLLKHEPGPANVAIPQQHPPIQPIQIRDRLGSGKRRPRNRNQPLFQRQPARNIRGGPLRIAAGKRSLGIAVEASQLLNGVAIPGFQRRIGIRGRGSRPATSQHYNDD
jgi:hypothetical protein